MIFQKSTAMLGMFTIVLIVGGCVGAVVVVLLLCAMCRTCEADSSKRMEVETVVSSAV